MGSVSDVKKTKDICDLVYTELDGMKNKIVLMREHISKSYGADSYVSTIYDRHLAELVDEINWKLQILSHSCPYDWKGSADFEGAVQVEDSEKPEFSPGYLGG